MQRTSPQQCGSVNGESVHRCHPNITPSDASAMNLLSSQQLPQSALPSPAGFPVREQAQTFFSPPASVEPSAPEIAPAAAQDDGIASKPLPAAPQCSAECTAKCLYDYTAEDGSELSFARGDVLHILSRSGKWWRAERCGAHGLVPSNFLEPLN